MPAITMESKLSAAVGGKAAKAFADAFGYETVGDLLRHYPRSWIGRGETSDLSELQPGEHTTVIARIVSSAQHPYRDRRTGQMAYRLETVVEVGEQSRLF